MSRIIFRSLGTWLLFNLLVSCVVYCTRVHFRHDFVVRCDVNHRCVSQRPINVSSVPERTAESDQSTFNILKIICYLFLWVLVLLLHSELKNFVILSFVLIRVKIYLMLMCYTDLHNDYFLVNFATLAPIKRGYDVLVTVGLFQCLTRCCIIFISTYLNDWNRWNCYCYFDW